MTILIASPSCTDVCRRIPEEGASCWGCDIGAGGEDCWGWIDEEEEEAAAAAKARTAAKSGLEIERIKRWLHSWGNHIN